MRWSYSCPHCQAGLNPDETVILVGEHGAIRTLVGFDPKPGSYRAYLPPGVEAEAGSTWDFNCPVCQRSLVTEVSDRLCALDMTTGGVRHRLYFSRVAGDQATFVVSAEGLIERHGRDAETHSLDLLDLM
jgi:hypothetical protein